MKKFADLKSYDPEKDSRFMRNVFFLSIFYGSIFFCVAYISAISTLFLIGGTKSIVFLFHLLKNRPDLHLIKLLSINYKYLMFASQKYHLLGFSGADFFLPKLIIGTGIPYTILAGVAFKMRYFLMEFRFFLPTASAHGDAHWATEMEIRKADLRAKSGILLGKDKKGYLVADGYQHALLFAPTGSGKGVGFVIPNLLFWEESMICHDIKLENYELTSGWRKRYLKQLVFVWEPANPKGISHCYNPLDWLSDEPGKVIDDIQKICNTVLPKQEFWTNEARNILQGAIGAIKADPTCKTSFGEVSRVIKSDDLPHYLSIKLDTLGSAIHPVAQMNIRAFLQKPDKERSGCISTLSSGIELWANPIIDSITAKSDFNIQMFKKQKTTVYVGLTPDNISRLKPLMAMFYQQATNFLSAKLPDKTEPYGILLMMDEFPTLGQMPQFLSGIAYFRGYHVRLFLIVQDTQQLKGAYEDHGMNSFLSNSKYRITFAANNIETARLISDLIGTRTIETLSYSKAKYLDLNPTSRSFNVSGSQRALLLPQEVISMPRDEQIILIESSPPIKTQKIFYYKDSKFTSKLEKPVPVPQQKIEVMEGKTVSGAKSEAGEQYNDSSDQNSDNISGLIE